MSHSRLQDRVISVVLLGFIGVGYAATLSFSRVALYPRLLLGVMALLAVVIGVRSVTARSFTAGSDEAPLTPARLLQPVFLGLMVVAYAVAIPWLGYFTATLIALPVFTVWMGLRSPAAPLLAGAGFAGAVYLLFRLQLGVPLPRGLLF